MGNLPSANGTHLLWKERDHRQRFASQCHELYLEPLPVMCQNNRANITAFQAVVRNINGQNDAVKFSDHESVLPDNG